MTHMGEISLFDWHKIPCEREGKTAGSEYLYLACWGLTFVLPGLHIFLLEIEEDSFINVLYASKGLFHILTG